ncbi:hypothetical protein PIB30_003679 [Stylosanthes scabra]|uniref:Uncharacterized protein n=1 Tax=Stylosanthes scabra TaxID=79078 RepID=A0ABU6Z0K7_9FABA|nr:hypothetical protein [Stylosanthes scabra]
MEGRASEEDYILEVVGPSDRLPFRAGENRLHFLRPFWLDDEREPFPWVYWNPEVRPCRINNLDPFKTLASRFLQSLPVGLGKKHDFKCCWIIDHSDAKVGAYLDSLLDNMDKLSRFDRLRARMAKVGSMGPRSILSTPAIFTGSVPYSTFTHLAVVAAGSSGGSQPKNVPPKTTLQKPIYMDGEEGAKEDSSADLEKRKRRRKLHESFLENTVLGEDTAWEHELHAESSRAHVLKANTRDFKPVGLESAISSNLKTEKELAAAKD